MKGRTQDPGHWPVFQRPFHLTYRGFPRQKTCADCWASLSHVREKGERTPHLDRGGGGREGVGPPRVPGGWSLPFPGNLPVTEGTRQPFSQPPPPRGTSQLPPDQLAGGPVCKHWSVWERPRASSLPPCHPAALRPCSQNGPCLFGWRRSEP